MITLLANDYNTSSHHQSPTTPGTLAPMLPCRLVLFFASVRELAPQWTWSFRLSTTADGHLWTEDDILQPGWPRDPIYGLDVTTVCPVQHGCFITYRRANHQRAARFLATEARQLVDDIADEFAPRIKPYLPD